jgi:integrase
MNRKPKSRWPRIRARKNKAGQITSFQLDLGKDRRIGSRARISYKTLAEAEAAAAQYRVERANFGSGAGILAPADLYDASKALSALRPYSATLLEAANFFVAHRQEALRSRPVSEVIPEVIRAKQQDGISVPYFEQLSALMRRFEREFGSRPICDISTQEIDDWLTNLKVSTVARKTYQSNLSVLFDYAKLRNYLRINPVKALPWPTVERKRPEFLSVAEAQALLLAANARWIPPIALGLFAGLRPISEVLRLDWADIRLEERVIDIHLSKNVSSHRYVPISDVLASWLNPYLQDRGPVYGRSDALYHKELGRVRRCAAHALREQGVDAPHLNHWNNDLLRHSFASYHVGAFGNAYQTAELMGHGSDIRMLKRHYQGRVRQTEALPYWQLFAPPQLPAPGQDCNLARYDDDIRARDREAKARYSRARKDEINARLRAKRALPHEEVNAKRRAQYAANPGKYNAQSRTHYAANRKEIIAQKGVKARAKKAIASAAATA